MAQNGLNRRAFLRNAGLTAGEIDCRLYVERCFFPSDRCFVVLEPGVETKCKEAARGQFAAAYMVQIIRRAMRKKEGHMGRLPNVDVVPVYDRTELVDQVIKTVKNNLFEGGLLVVAVLFAFLGNLRAAVIVALAIPLSMLFAFSGMLQFGISASLLSLGAVDFGMIVDSSVVMAENCVRHIAHGVNRRRP